MENGKWGKRAEGNLLFEVEYSLQTLVSEPSHSVLLLSEVRGRGGSWQVGVR
jgi:hypothetical protein